MCNPAAFAAAALVAGAGLDYVNTRKANNRASNEIMQGIRERRANNQQIQQRGMQAAERFDPNARGGAIEAAQQQATQSIQGALDGGEALGFQNTAQTDQGALSDAFVTERAKRNIAENQFGVRLAREFGKLRGFGDSDIGIGIGNSQDFSEIGRLGSENRISAQSAEARATLAGQPNEGMSLFSGLLKAGGQAGLMMGGAPTAAAAGSSLQAIRLPNTAPRLLSVR